MIFPAKSRHMISKKLKVEIINEYNSEKMEFLESVTIELN
jgi:hypothetical protein